jgi:hypothetical protein
MFDIAFKISSFKTQNVGRLPDNINILSKLIKYYARKQNISNGVMVMHIQIVLRKI